MNNELFDSYKPELTERFKSNARRTLANIIEDLGPELKNVYNDWTWAKTFSTTVKPVFDLKTKGISEKKLEAAASKYAADTVETWKNKIAEKMGMIDNGKVHHLDGCRFCISGTKEGRTVSITQDMIVNISRLGTLFNQFPARIALDGKAISAAKFKKAF